MVQYLALTDRWIENCKRLLKQGMNICNFNWPSGTYIITNNQKIYFKPLFKLYLSIKVTVYINTQYTNINIPLEQTWKKKLFFIKFKK